MATTAAQDEYNELFRDKSKRSHHPSDSPHDNSDAASFLHDDSDDERVAPSINTVTNNAGAKYTVPTQRHQANTGVKGVITDAQAYRAAARSRRDGSASRASMQREREAQISGVQPYITSGLGLDDGKLPGSDEDEDFGGQDDDQFMDQWRQNRLKELQGGQRIGGSSREKGGRRQHFGGLVPVDGPGFLDAVDGSGSHTVVVVFIYDDKSEVSQLFEDCIRTMARKYVNTRFVKLHFHDAEMEPAGVPAVLAYRGGDKFAGLVPILDEVPDDMDVNAQTLEVLFQKHQIL